MNVYGVVNLGKDPEWKQIGAGLTTVTAADSNRKKVDGEWTSVTSWYTLKMWGERGQKLAEAKKGDKILMESASIEVDDFKTKDGAERRMVVITVFKFRNLTAEFEKRGRPQAAQVDVGNDDGLPF